jgi:hypothetical protein
MAKKAKGITYTREEQHLVMDLVEEQKAFLDSKETDKVSLKKKNSAWEEVTQRYNARGPSSGPRSLKQLKKYVNE